MSAELFYRKSLSDIAAQLDVHPFDIARMMGLRESGLPAELHFDTKDTKEIASELRLEIWWAEPIQIEDGHHQRRLVREFARKLVTADLSQPTRADNMYRGLEGSDFALIRSVLNTFITLNVVQSVQTLTGIDISLVEGPATQKVLEDIVNASKFPKQLEELIQS